jgi:hypothetical protein
LVVLLLVRVLLLLVLVLLWRRPRLPLPIRRHHHSLSVHPPFLRLHHPAIAGVDRRWRCLVHLLLSVVRRGGHGHGRVHRVSRVPHRELVRQKGHPSAVLILHHRQCVLRVRVVWVVWNLAH